MSITDHIQSRVCVGSVTLNAAQGEWNGFCVLPSHKAHWILLSCTLYKRYSWLLKVECEGGVSVCKKGSKELICDV